MLIFETVTLPLGIGTEKPFCVWHLTDLHLMHADGRDGAYENEHARARIPVFPSAHTMEEELLAAFQNAEEKPDFLLLTGDIIDFPTQANLDALTALLRAAGCPYLYVPGNHDWSFPKGYHSEEQIQTYLPKLSAAVGQPTSFCAVMHNGICFVGADDSRDRVSTDVAEKTAEVLAACKEKHIPAVVCLHVPIQSAALDPEAKRVWRAPVVIGDERADEATRAFCDAVEENANAVIAGHVHFTHDAPLDRGRCTQYISPLSAGGTVRKYYIV